MMKRADKSTWALTAIAVACAACGLLALNSLEVQAQDETLSLASQSAALQDVPEAYRAECRADIMIRAAGSVLN